MYMYIVCVCAYNLLSFPSLSLSVCMYICVVIHSLLIGLIYNAGGITV